MNKPPCIALVAFCVFAVQSAICQGSETITLDNVDLAFVSGPETFQLDVDVAGSTGSAFASTNFIGLNNHVFTDPDGDTTSGTLVATSSVTVTDAVGGDDLTFDVRITGVTTSMTQTLRFQDHNNV